MKPMPRRYSWVSPRESLVRSWPLTKISPSLGLSWQSSSRSSVDLPAPLGPVRKTNSPLSTFSERSCSAYKPRVYSFERWFVSITLAVHPAPKALLVRLDAASIALRCVTHKLDMQTAEPRVEIEDERQGTRVVAEPYGRGEGTTIVGAALDGGRNAKRVHVHAGHVHAFGAVNGQLNDKVTPGVVDRETGTVTRHQGQTAHVEERRHGVTRFRGHRQRHRPLRACFGGRPSRSNDVRRLVEDERARDMPRALVLIAFVHLRQQLAITLRGEDVLCLKEPCNPRRGRGLDDETIRRSFDAHRNVTGGYGDAGAAPVDPVLRQSRRWSRRRANHHP